MIARSYKRGSTVWPHFFRQLATFVALGVLLHSIEARAASVTVEKLDDASISHDAQQGTWTISAGGATLTLLADSSRDYNIVSLLSPSGRNWTTRMQADTNVTVRGATSPLGTRGEFRFENAVTSNNGHQLRLDITFLLRSAPLRVTRHIVVGSGSPSFEVWTTYEGSSSDPVEISNLNAFELSIGAGTGTVRWLTGNQADADDDARDSAFMRRQMQLAVGQTLTVGSQGRSSEQTVPWFAIDGDQDEFYTGLMWSGPWSLTGTRVGNGIAISWALSKVTTVVKEGPVDGPHAIFGVARGGVPAATAALGSYVLNGLRGGRPITPLVTYNTWFAYGTNVDELSMRTEIERAAALGAELFVVDAGWYLGADTADTGNFDQGLGTWVPDPARFPNGLKPLTDYAHALGMKFGIWMEPERVNLSVVGRGGVDESWLATENGSYDSDHSAQICLSSAGRQWVMDRLTALLDDVQPDYLKWDNNLWVNCDRDGHDHGATDGSFAHVNALYQMLDDLRQRYPNLLIENCSAGGNRLDLGMVRYTDAGWMDDRTAPSVHVRHNIEGLSMVFPPAYLLSFVIEHDTEPLHDSPDLSLYFRSRMGGVLGLCFRLSDFSEAEIAEISHELAIYKNTRQSLSSASAALLSPQARQTGTPEWDVLQATAQGGDALVLYAFQDNEGSEHFTIKPTGLNAAATYEVKSVDVGTLGTASGADIMANGVEVIASPNTAGHILVLTAQ